MTKIEIVNASAKLDQIHKSDPPAADEIPSEKPTVNPISIVLFVMLPLGLIATTSFSHAVLLPIQLVEMIGDNRKSMVLGAIAACTSLSGMLAAVLSGFISDRLKTPFGSRTPIITIATITMIVSFICRVYTVGTGGVFLFLNASLLCLQDICCSSAMACFIAMLPDAFNHKQIGLVSGLHSMMTIAGGLVGAAIFGGTFRTMLPQWGTVVLLSLLSTLCLFIFLLFAREPLDHYTTGFSFALTKSTSYTDESLSRARRIIIRARAVVAEALSCFKDKNFGFCFISRSFFALCMGYLQNFTLFYFTDKFVKYSFFGNKTLITTPQQAQAVYVGVMLLTAIIMAVFSGALSDKIGRKLIIFASAASFSLAMLATTFISNFTFVLSTCIISGASLGSFFATDLGLINDIIKHSGNYGTSLSIFNMAQTVPTVLSSPLSGAVIQLGEKIHIGVPHVGYNIMFGLCSLLSAISAALICFVRVKPNDQSTENNFSEDHHDNIQEDLREVVSEC